jgi:hypothetical protein
LSRRMQISVARARRIPFPSTQEPFRRVPVSMFEGFATNPLTHTEEPADR